MLNDMLQHPPCVFFVKFGKICFILAFSLHRVLGVNRGVPVVTYVPVLLIARCVTARLLLTTARSIPARSSIKSVGHRDGREIGSLKKAKRLFYELFLSIRVGLFVKDAFVYKNGTTGEVPGFEAQTAVVGGFLCCAFIWRKPLTSLLFFWHLRLNFEQAAVVTVRK